MSGIEKTPLRIPDVWAPAWFRTFVVEYMSKADVRNAIGIGIAITSEGNSVATLNVTAGMAEALEAHNQSPSAHQQAFAAHKAEADPHPQYAHAGEGGGGESTTHAELLTDGLGNFVFAGGDSVTVLGVPNA